MNNTRPGSASSLAAADVRRRTARGVPFRDGPPPHVGGYPHTSGKARPILLCGILLAAACLLILLLLPSRTPIADETASRVEPVEDPASPFQSHSRDEWGPLVVVEPSASPESPEQPAETFDPRVLHHPVPLPFAPEEITVHLLSDFARGDLSNLVVDDVLRLGDGPGFPPRGAPPGQRSGVYISPEQEPDEPFDVLVAETEADIPDGSDLVFEFRTRSGGGDWSVWERVEPNEMTQPLGLGAPATAWQYRLTFFANDSNPGPEVQSVAFATRPVLLALPGDPFSQ